MSCTRHPWEVMCGNQCPMCLFEQTISDTDAKRTGAHIASRGFTLTAKNRNLRRWTKDLGPPTYHGDDEPDVTANFTTQLEFNDTVDPSFFE